MLNRLPFHATPFAQFVSALASRFRRSHSSSVDRDAKVFPTGSEPRLSIAVQDESAEDRICRFYQDRGQFLARQDRWAELAREIHNADSARNVTPGGMPLSDLLAYGARSDVVLAAEHALADRIPVEDAPLLDGIGGLEAIRRELTDNPMIDLIVALTHIDLAWLWRSTTPETGNGDLSRQRCAAHFDRADKLLSPYCPVEMDSPAIAAAKCALLSGTHDPQTRVADDYEDLIDLNPLNYRHMRAFGVHLLPRWFGDYGQLEREACRTAARTRDIWGAGGYTWVYLDAITIDDQARAQVDVGFFIDGLRDIIQFRPEQEMVNLLAAYCAIALSKRHDNPRLPCQQIVDCADWLIRDHLREIHPMVWAHASTGFDNNARVTSQRRFAALGRAAALRVIADRFREDLDAGHRVAFTPNGPVTNAV